MKSQESSKSSNSSKPELNFPCGVEKRHSENLKELQNLIAMADEMLRVSWVQEQLDVRIEELKRREGKAFEL